MLLYSTAIVTWNHKETSLTWCGNNLCLVPLDYIPTFLGI